MLPGRDKFRLRGTGFGVRWRTRRQRPDHEGKIWGFNLGIMIRKQWIKLGKDLPGF
jgi:hypothetical protein